MKKFVFICLAFVLFSEFAFSQLPRLTNRERRQGWILLFDGKTSNGWTSWRDGRPFPEQGWVISNGVLSLDPTVERPGDIITEAKFSDFELSLEFRITEGANSGIKYFILPGTTLGLEFQILDDQRHPDAQQGRDGNRLQGGLYDVLPPINKINKPIGEWNHARIISKGNHVEHWLNGRKILSFERGTPEWDELVSKSKFVENPGWGTPTESPILLQDHRDAVSFRNIKIRRL